MRRPVVLAQARMLSVWLSCLLSAGAVKEAEASPRPIPVLSKDPVVDGALKDLAPSLELKIPTSAGPSADVAAKIAFRRDTLYVGFVVHDDRVTAEDRLDVTVYFPGAGTTAQGVVYRFDRNGLTAKQPDSGPLDWAQALLKTAAVADSKGFVLEVAIPARAWPRFPALKPLDATVCIEYSDVDAPSGEPTLLSNCPHGDMLGGPIRLPAELRKNLKLDPSGDVEGIEPQEHGWLGFSRLHFPTWAQGESDLTPLSLTELVLGPTAVDPTRVALPVPEQLVLPDNRPVFSMLSGKNPFARKDCVDGSELRVAFYVVSGSVASRVLEWPVANCRLGRAMRFELSAEGELSIGYTNGSTAHFIWSGDHFERSELG